MELRGNCFVQRSSHERWGVARMDYFAPANSVFVSWPPRNARSPAASGNSDSTSNPVDVLPVASFTQPIRYGPPKPARLPIEFISAMPPAAAVPESHAVGSVQNTAKVRAEFFEREIARHLEQKIADEENSGAPSKNQRRELQIRVHGQRGEAEIDAVEIGKK